MSYFLLPQIKTCNLKTRLYKTPFEGLTITISQDTNNNRIVSHSSSTNTNNCIQLRSGRIIDKFIFYTMIKSKKFKTR